MVSLGSRDPWGRWREDRCLYLDLGHGGPEGRLRVPESPPVTRVGVAWPRLPRPAGLRHLHSLHMTGARKGGSIWSNWPQPGLQPWPWERRRTKGPSCP